MAMVAGYFEIRKEVERGRGKLYAEGVRVATWRRIRACVLGVGVGLRGNSAYDMIISKLALRFLHRNGRSLSPL